MKRILNRLFTIFMVLSLLIFGSVIPAQAQTIPAANTGAGNYAAPGDEVTILDTNLREAIYFAIPKNLADPITQGELAAITALYAGNFGGTKTIADLEGIQYLTGAKRIELPLNNITDVSKLAGLTGLEILQLCYNPNLKDISPLNNLHNLTTFWATYCPISYIDFMADMQFNNAGVNINFTNDQIIDITALADNPNIKGDGTPANSVFVNLDENMLDTTNGSIDMLNLLKMTNRGAMVSYANQKPKPPTSTLTVNFDAAQGTVNKNPKSSIYVTGDTVQLTATPAAGWLFNQWTGPVTNPNAAQTSIVMNDNYTVTASFTPIPVTYTLTVNFDAAQGAATRTPDKLVYDSGETVQLTATPAAGWLFNQWTRPVTNPNAAQTSIVMNDNYTITASFTPNPVTYTLTVNVDAAQGTATRTPDNATYNSGDTVQLTATPAAGWLFNQWTGPVTDSNAAQTSIVMNDNYIVTAIFSADTSAGGGGGGGGGAIFAGSSSGGGGTATKRIMGFQGIIMEDGTLLDSLEAYSVDEWVKLTLPINTILLNSANVFLPLIAIETLSSAPDGVPDTDIIGPMYSFSPEGAHFSPPIKLTFRYDALTLPEFADVQNLKIVWWDKVNKEWVELVCTVDTVAKTVSTYISHFSLYALSLEVKPASFTITDLSLSKNELNKGETTQLSALVTNTGDVPGTYALTLNVNGTMQEEKSVELSGGQSSTVSFDLSFDQFGSYNLSLNDITKVISVLPTQASFKLDGLAISPLTSTVGDDITVSFMVSNNGQSAGDFTVNCLLDGALFQSQQLNIPGDSSREVSFTLKIDTAGTHNIIVNDVLTARFEVRDVPVAVETAVSVASIVAPPESTTPAVDNAVKSNLGTVLFIVAGGLLVIGVLTAVLVSRSRRSHKY